MMKNTTIKLSIVFFVLILSACTGNKEKTEVSIQLSEVKYLHKLSNSTTDSIFIKALNLAKAGYPANMEFVDAFNAKVLEIDPNIKLAAFFNTFELKDRISFKSSNKEVIAVLKEEINIAKEKTLQVLTKRLESSFKTSFFSGLFNKIKVDIVKIPVNNSYTIVFNRKMDKERLIKLLEAESGFGFWETYDISEIWENLNNANKKLSEIADSLLISGQKNAKDKQTTSQKGNSLIGLVQKEKTQSGEIEKNNVLFSILNPSVNSDGTLQRGCVAGVSKISDTALINKYLYLPEIKILFPVNLKFLWEIKPIGINNEYISLVAIKMTSRDGLAPLDGSCVMEASASESNGQNLVNMSMNAEGAKIWSRLTKENIGKQIAIVFNHSIYSYPMVNSEITGGRSQISGNFTPDEAKDMASLLNAGNMPEIKVIVVDIN